MLASIWHAVHDCEQSQQQLSAVPLLVESNDLHDSQSTHDQVARKSRVNSLLGFA
jgi:hypothetical protein